MGVGGLKRIVAMYSAVVVADAERASPASWFETALARLLTMRVWHWAACSDLVLRSALARLEGRAATTRRRSLPDNIPKGPTTEGFSDYAAAAVFFGGKRP